MSQLQQLQARVLSNMVLYLLAGIGLYILALFLGTIIKIFFGITFISYQGVDVDIVTYIAYGSIDLILTLIQIFGTAILVMLIWIWNAFVVGIIFQLLDGALYIFLQVHTFSNVAPISDATLLQIVDAYAGIMEIFSVTSWEILHAGSTIADDIVTGITGGRRGTRR